MARQRRDEFRIKDEIKFDDMTRNMRAAVEQVCHAGKSVTVTNSVGKPAWLLYAIELAAEEENDPVNVEEISPSAFVKRKTSYQAVMRVTGKPLIISVNKDVKAVIKLHPDASNSVLESARDKFAKAHGSIDLAVVNRKLDEILSLLKKKA